MKAPSQRNLGSGSMQPMVAINQIEKFGRQIGEQFGAEQVILFGSYAQGSVTADSDVDL